MPPFLPVRDALVKTRFGPGRILSVTHSGAVVSLYRMNNLKVAISLEELANWNGEAESTIAAREEEPNLYLGEPRYFLHDSAEATRRESVVRQVVMTKERFDARCSIEALRFGIVPVRSISQVTLGYPTLQRWASTILPSGPGSRVTVSEVWGPFGTGKSHTMATIRQIAKVRNYVTARVEVDGNNVSLSDPASVLRQLWRTVEAEGMESATPLLDLNIRAIKRGRDVAASSLQAFTRVQSNLLTIDTLMRARCLDAHSEAMEILLACGDELTVQSWNQEMWRDLMSAGVSPYDSENFARPRVLVGHLVDDRAKDFVECLVGYSVLAKEAGFDGLVITIDEFEVEQNLPRKMLDRLNMVIWALEDAIVSDGHLSTAPLAIFVATVGEDGHEGDQIIDYLVEKSGGSRHQLRAWSPQKHRELAERVFELYSLAYGISDEFDESIAREVQTHIDREDLDASGMIRSFLKQYVGALDSTFGPSAH